MIGSGAGRRLDTRVLTGSPLRDRDKGSRLRSYVVGRRTDEPVVGALLDDVRRPARDARHDEERSEHRRGDAAKVVGGRAIEIEIVEKFLLAPHHALDALGDRVKPLVSSSGGEVL